MLNIAVSNLALKMTAILAVAAGLLFHATGVWAEIAFEEVTAAAGIAHAGASQGASWGDLNGDGWPDLWVGNHYQPPSLYLNRHDGTFADVIASAWSADPRSDKHGAAWADFDNDGDQDLFVMIGAVRGQGEGAKYLFVNERGVLKDEAERRGLSYPLGRGRTPLWFDADRDGRLDLLMMTSRRPDGKGRPVVFRQTAEAFEAYNPPSGFKDHAPSGMQKLGERLRRLIHLDFTVPTWVDAAEFAQLAELSGDGLLDLAAYGRPLRFYSLQALPFDDFTQRINLPDGREGGNAKCRWCWLKIDNVVAGVRDAAIEDFDGDGRADMYFARPRRPDSEFIQTAPSEVRGMFAESGGKGGGKVLHFRTHGDVTFELNVPWDGDASPIRTPLIAAIGPSRKQVVEGAFTLSPAEPGVADGASVQTAAESEVAISYDPAAGEWSLQTLGRPINFILRSTEAMQQLRAEGLKPFAQQGGDLLLLRRGEGFVKASVPNGPANQVACNSVAAADFDNDMDVDIFLVCTGQVGNIVNRLLENDGKGHFTEVPMAGGAAGSMRGRGDVAAVADYDRDGFLDLFITNGFGPSPFSDEGPHQLFRNRGNGNHWLEIDLEGSVSNRDGIGASIELEAGGVLQTRAQGGGMHRDTQNHQRIHFGLAQNARADRVTIRWPSGIQQELRNLQVDQIVRIKEEQ